MNTSEWHCHLCGTPVSWGTSVCPLCGSALDWEEEDEDDPLAYLMPSNGYESLAASRWRRVRRYAALALAAGIVLGIMGVTSGFTPSLIVPGVLLIAAGGYTLLTRRDS